MRCRNLIVCAAAVAVGLWAAGPAVKAPSHVRVSVRVQPDSPDPDPKTFHATIDKAPARVVRVLTPADPQMILLVLDLTGDLGAIEPAKATLIAEIEKLPPSAYIGVLRAQDGMTVLADPSKNRASAVEAVRNLTISGRPGLLDTLDPVERLADAVGRKSQVRMSVLFVTDSNVSDYREDFSNPVINSSDPHDLSRKFPETLIQEKISKIHTQLAARQTPLHIVHIAYRGDRLSEAYQNGLDQLASQMAGAAEFCRSRAEIPEAIQRAFRAIQSEYVLILAAPEHCSATPQIQVSAGDVPLVCRTRMTLKER
jgi:hypothetical protein